MIELMNYEKYLFGMVDSGNHGPERSSRYLPAPGDDGRREERKSPDAVNRRHAADRNNCRL